MDVYMKQQRIAELARRYSEEPLTLLHNYLDMDLLRYSYRQLRKESATGIDDVSVEEYGKDLENNLDSLLNRAKSGKYRAPAVRGTEIPKPGSKEKRPLGIPTTEDKVLQKAVSLILEPVYGEEFYHFSFGFRRGKSQHKALSYLWTEMMNNRISWVIDLDIRRFFDTVKHKVLQDLLRKRVRDGVLIRLIGKWLNAGVLKDGSLERRDEGTPQGGIISPLMSNIYLHEALDKWFSQEVSPYLRGRSCVVRYADDAVLGFELGDEADLIMKALKKRFEKYGLQLNPRKTRLVPFRRPQDGSADKEPKNGTFDFLGFTHYWGKSRKGKWVIKRKTSKSKFREKLKVMNLWCRRNRHLPSKLQYEKLCVKLKGHYAYYGITCNAVMLSRFRCQVTRIWRKWLNRRSRKGKVNWDRFNQALKQHYPLPQIRIVHSIYAAKP